MKTALCFACTGRSIVHTFDNIKGNLIDPLEGCDIYLNLVQGSNAVDTVVLFEKENVVNTSISFEKPVDIKEYNFRNNWPYGENRPNVDVGREIFINMIKARSKFNHMIDEMGTEYDRVIFSRLDVLYDKKVDYLDGLDLSKINIPDFHNWGGYNDRFAVSSRENMRNYFSLYDNVDDYVKEGHELHAESSLKHHLDKFNSDIEHIPMRFIRVRSNGNLEETVDDLDKEWNGIA
tara:strand:- start:476 stop:1177 length:702 start_codon:yes stop_codon:yes gene_type:complete